MADKENSRGRQCYFSLQLSCFYGLFLRVSLSLLTFKPTRDVPCSRDILHGKFLIRFAVLRLADFRSAADVR